MEKISRILLRLQLKIRGGHKIIFLYFVFMGFMHIKILAQCSSATPCVNNISDYSCITIGTSSDLEANGRLLPFPGAASTQAQKIIVANYIDFNDDYEFAPGTEIIMLPGALMSVRSGVHARFLDQVTLRGCGDSWYGIIVNGNGYLYINNSTLSNSCEGIILQTNARARIINNTFTDNFRCIQANGAVSLEGEGIAHNVFDGTLNSNINCAPPPFRRAITLTNVPQITIGNMSGNGQPNQFVAYSTSIYANNSNLDVFNSVFANKISGTAISLKGIGAVYSATITGLGEDISSPKMIQMYGIGVLAENYNLKISDAFFEKVDKAVLLVKENSLPVGITITESRIENYEISGIEIDQSIINQANISQNEIHDNSNGFDGQRAGIKWANTSLASVLSRAKISDNMFFDDPKISPDPMFVQYQSYGAWLSGSSDVVLEDNSFFQNYQTDIEHEFKGVWLFNSPSNKLINNAFIGNFGPASINPSLFRTYRGADVTNSLTSLISCNNSQNLNEGFYFNSNSDHTAFQYNLMSDNTNGLYLAPGGIIGQQRERENRWTGILPGNGVAEANFDGNPGQGLLARSEFRINSSDQNSPFWANPRIPANGWFEFSGNNVILPEYQCIEEWGEDEDILSTANTMAISGIFEPYKGYPASTWEAELDAFSLLSEHPELRLSGSPQAVFYDTHYESNLGKLCRAKQAWEQATLFSPSLELLWFDNQLAIAAKLDEVRQQTQLLQNAQTENEQQQGVLALITLNAELTALQQANQELSAQYKFEVESKANQLAFDLSDIDSTTVWEQNLKTVIELSVVRLLSGSAQWTTNQYTALKSIADQCRHEGGIGVVMARAAIESFQYDDEALCPGEGMPRGTETTHPRMVLAPNPASDYCVLNFGRPINGHLAVFNAQGQLVHSVQLAEAVNYKLDTSTLSAGLYTLKVYTGQEWLPVYKLSVIH